MSIHFGAKVNTPRQKHGLFLLLGKHRKRKACLAMRQAKLSKLAYKLINLTCYKMHFVDFGIGICNNAK